MIKLGITGGLGSGKSLAAEFFKEFGAIIYDADLIAKTLINENPELQERLKIVFGEEIFEKGGKLNRSMLAEAAFSSRLKQQVLNDIIHPYVLHKLEEICRHEKERGTSFLAIEASMLFEAKSEKQYDAILVVTASEETRLKRSLKRSTLTLEQIQKRMDLQMPEEDKISRADYVIYNEGTPLELKKKCRLIFDSLQQ